MVYPFRICRIRMFCFSFCRMKFLILLLFSVIFCLTAEDAFFDFSFVSLPIFIYLFRTAADIIEF